MKTRPINYFLAARSLKSLTLDQCQWWNIKVLNVLVPKLLRLTIIEPAYNANEPEEFCNCRITVVGTNLIHFKYDDIFRHEYYLCNSPPLDKACIEGFPKVLEHGFYRFSRLLQCLANVKDFELRLEVPKGEERVLDNIPMFKNLTPLQISRATRNGVTKMLQNSPHLSEILILYEGIRLPFDDIDPAPLCLSSHLKVIELRVYGQEVINSRNAYTYLLENAFVLKKITISFYCNWIGSRDEENIKKHILELPIGSKDRL